MTCIRLENNFDEQASLYARYRPKYPKRLFSFLASIAPDTKVAWDCGTGNGQAALALTSYFQKVLATDISENQIKNAFKNKKINYWVSRCKDTNIVDGSIDLITVAQALHWFEINAFYREAQRALKPGGIIAVWCYHLSEIEPEIDRIITKYYYEVVGKYWHPVMKLVRDHYRSIPFPFNEISHPEFSIEVYWEFTNIIGFLKSWSATIMYIKEQKRDPIELIKNELANSWAKPEYRRLVRFPLYLKIGKKN
ncbi:MAG: class I SAM-dependent methyltransferase [Candidatus Hodarchaeota archaeon]